MLRRRNQILVLMAVRGFVSREQLIRAEHRPLPDLVPHTLQPFRSSAVIEHVLDELRAVHADFSMDDLMQGRLQVYSTVDARVQHIVSDALPNGSALQKWISNYDGRFKG